MDNYNNEARNLKFIKNDIEYMKLCLDITIYWAGSAFNRVDGIIDFYEQCIGVIGKSVTYYETETMGGAQEINKDTFDLIPFWFGKTKTRRGIYILFLESGPGANLPSDKAFVLRSWEFEDKQVGALRLILPIDFIAPAISPFIDLAKNLVRKLDFASGHAGYAINWNETGDFGYDAQEQMYVVSQRYPGIDLPALTSTLFAIPKGIKCANWLTFLNWEYRERLGGTDAIVTALGKDIRVHELDRGILIQAGAMPQIGDVNRRHNLPLYHQVGRVLAPIRVQDHPAFIVHGEEFYDDEVTREWLGRFDSRLL